MTHRRATTAIGVVAAFVFAVGVLVVVFGRDASSSLTLVDTTRSTTTVATTTTAPTTTAAVPPPSSVVATTVPASTVVTTTTTTSTTTTTTAATTTSTTPRPVTGDDILLVWISGGLPDGFADDVVALPTVRASTVAVGGQADLVATFGADGGVREQYGDGWKIPLDVIGVDPATYAGFRPSIAAALDALAPGRGLLTESSAALRGIGVGGRIVLTTGEVSIVGVVPDIPGAGAELLIHTDDSARLGLDTQRFLYVDDTDRAATERAIRDRTPPGAYLSLRPSSDVRWLRHGDRVEPKIIIKRRFGEFPFRDAAGRAIEMDPAWVAANIRTEAVPILGEIRCHRDVIPVVRAAMQALVDQGKADTVDPADYAGCWNPRRIGATAPLSHHSWGAAIDINVDGNPRGDFETQDPALVEALTSRGFSWGGRWEYPDPAHYEAAPALDATWPP